MPKFHGFFKAKRIMQFGEDALLIVCALLPHAISADIDEVAEEVGRRQGNFHSSFFKKIFYKLEQIQTPR
jgi:hypothetical protein